jgi:hypothetical protein
MTPSGAPAGQTASESQRKDAALDRKSRPRCIDSLMLANGHAVDGSLSTHLVYRGIRKPERGENVFRISETFVPEAVIG